jgi:hypothetical protein
MIDAYATDVLLSFLAYGSGVLGTMSLVWACGEYLASAKRRTACQVRKW